MGNDNHICRKVEYDKSLFLKGSERNYLKINKNNVCWNFMFHQEISSNDSVDKEKCKDKDKGIGIIYCQKGRCRIDVYGWIHPEPILLEEGDCLEVSVDLLCEILNSSDDIFVELLGVNATVEGHIERSTIFKDEH